MNQLDNIPDNLELDEAIKILKKLNNKIRSEYILYNMTSKTYYNILRMQKIIDMLEIPEKMGET
tara:strand:- start:306 stop:497 length:192 start_codon:yes stop_codon:yes gene_type:complete